jgi:hypothetical protein
VIRYRLILAAGLAITGPGCSVGAVGQDEATLLTQLDSLSERVTALEARASETVELVPGDSSYTLAQADAGQLAVAIEGVKETSDGVTVTIGIGNLTSATLEGIEAAVAWAGPVVPGEPIANHRSTSLGTVPLVKSAPPGKWSSAIIRIPGITTAQLGSLQLSGIATSGIVLR